MVDSTESEGRLDKSRMAYHWIRKRISTGDYGPGCRLVLGQIADQLDVSVAPVRAALRRLATEGLVTSERNVGARVAMVEEAEYVATMQTLGLVEGFATALAAPAVSPEEIGRARAVNRQLAECLEHFDPPRFTRLNRDFHALLFGRCPNQHLLGLVHRGWNRLTVLRDSTFSFVPGRARGSVREHEELLGLIEARAPALDIELATRSHRTATLDAFRACRGSRRSD